MRSILLFVKKWEGENGCNLFVYALNTSNRTYKKSIILFVSRGDYQSGLAKETTLKISFKGNLIQEIGYMGNRKVKMPNKRL